MSSIYGRSARTNEIPGKERYEARYKYYDKETETYRVIEPSEAEALQLWRHLKIFEGSIAAQANTSYLIQEDSVKKLRPGVAEGKLRSKGREKVVKGVEVEAIKESVASVAKIFGVSTGSIQVELLVHPQSIEGTYQLAYDRELLFAGQVSRALESLSSPNFIVEMKKNGYSEEEISRFRRNLSDLRGKTAAMLEFMEDVNRFIQEGKHQDAAEHYAKHMWRVYQPYATNLLATAANLAQCRTRMGESVLSLDTDRFAFHEMLFEEVLAQTKVEERGVDLETALPTFYKLNPHFTTGNRAERLQDEFFLQDEFRRYREYVHDHALYSIREYESTFQKLADYSIAMTDKLKEVDQLLGQGQVVSAMDVYSDLMLEVYVPYLAALAEAKKAIYIVHTDARGNLPQLALGRATEHLHSYRETLAHIEDYGHGRWNDAKEAVKKAVEENGPIVGKAFPVPVAELKGNSRQILTLAGKNVASIGKLRTLLEGGPDALMLKMRENGFNELESLFITGQISEAYEQSQALEEKLSEMEQLIDKEKYIEAMNQYAKCIIEAPTEYFQSLLSLSLVSEYMIFDDKKLEQLNKIFPDPFPKDRDGKLSEFQEILRFIPRVFSDHANLLEGISTTLGKLGHPHQDIDRAWARMKEAGKRQNAAIGEMEDAIKPGDKLYKLVYENPSKGEGKAIYNAGFTGKVHLYAADLKEINRVGKGFAQVLEPLYCGRCALQVETDSNKKRAILAQMRASANDAQKKIQSLEKDLKKAGGRGRLREFESLLERSYPPEKMISKQGKREVAAFNKRTNLLNEIRDDLGLVKFEAPRRVQKNLLEGVLLKDAEFEAACAGEGLTKKQIEQIGNHYDAYLEAYAPLYLAKKRLDSDPENKVLQDELRVVFKKQEPKLADASAKFNKIGGMKLPNKLHRAIDAYTATSKNPERSARAKRADIADALSKMDDEVVNIKERLKVPTVWEQNWLSRLFTTSPLSRFSKKWQKKGVTKVGMEKAEKVFNSLAKELAPVQALTRAIEATPHDKRLRKELLKVLNEAKKDRLTSIEKELDEIEGDLQGIQDNIDKFLKGIMAKRNLDDPDPSKRVLDPRGFKGARYRDEEKKMEAAGLSIWHFAAYDRLKDVNLVERARIFRKELNLIEH